MVGNSMSVHSKSEFDSPLEPTVAYILSPCPLAAFGLTALLKHSGGFNKTEVIIPTGLSPKDDAAIVQRIQTNNWIVVFIPPEPVLSLSMLKILAILLHKSPPSAQICVLSHFCAPNLYRTLQRLAGLTLLPHALVAVRATLPCRLLQNLFSGKHRVLPLCQQANQEENMSGKRAEAMTSKELDAALEYLSGGRIRNPSAMSFKTLYSQRRSGLSKLMVHLPSAREHLPLKLRPVTRLPMVVKDSSQSLSHAIRDGQFFPVFQPVVDSNMRVQGFEILTRWLRDGRVIMPAEFLPLIHNHHTWLKLTAFVINVAVQNINQFAGQLYFTVNIPSCVANSSSLFRMVKLAQTRLHAPEWANRLVLEFSETTSTFSKVCEMQEAGYSIFLDDCFSQTSVMFPVRHVQFSGYKLDMSLISTFQDSQHDENLIRSLIYYCQLTGSQCIAEGVDSREKFTALANLGVGGFQGFYISPPVTSNHLEEIVLSLGGGIRPANSYTQR